MKRSIAGPSPWVLVSAPILALILVWNPLTEASTAFKIRRNLTSSNTGLTPAASIGIPRRLPSPWRGGLRGRSRTTTTTTTEATTPTPEEPLTFAYNTSVPDDDAYRQQVESAEDVNPRSVVWPLRARPSASKRFRIPTPTTPEPQLLLKLLQPKPTRPAIYSLDGFVPKPSIQRVVSTEAPLDFKKTDLQLLSSVPRWRKMSKQQQDVEEEVDEYQALARRRRRKKPVSRYTAFARKGIPGEDFPVFTFIPQTEFDCGPQPGLYADPFTDCQVWHMCPGGNLSPRHSFLCPNGTIFNQKKRICDWWYNVDCRKHTRRIRSEDLLWDF